MSPQQYPLRGGLHGWRESLALALSVAAARDGSLLNILVGGRGWNGSCSLRNGTGKEALVGVASREASLFLSLHVTPQRPLLTHMRALKLVGDYGDGTPELWRRL